MELLKRLSPSNCDIFITPEAKAFRREQPKLIDLSNKTEGGETTTELFLQTYLLDFQMYISKGEALTTEQLIQVSNAIVREYVYLKITEVMLFFRKLKAGKFGHFFGKLETDKLTEALNEFIKYAREQTHRVEEEEKARLKAEREANEVCITREQYDLLVKLDLMAKWENTDKAGKERIKQFLTEKLKA